MNYADKLRFANFIMVKSAEQERVNPGIAALLSSVPGYLGWTLGPLHAAAKTGDTNQAIANSLLNFTGRTTGAVTGFLGSGGLPIGAHAGEAVGGAGTGALMAYLHNVVGDNKRKNLNPIQKMISKLDSGRDEMPTGAAGLLGAIPYLGTVIEPAYASAKTRSVGAGIADTLATSAGQLAGGLVTGLPSAAVGEMLIPGVGIGGVLGGFLGALPGQAVGGGMAGALMADIHNNKTKDMRNVKHDIARKLKALVGVE